MYLIKTRCSFTSPSSGARWKHGLVLGILLRILLGLLLPRRPIPPKLLGDGLLKGIVGQWLNKQVPHGLEDGDDLGRGLPVLGLKNGEANVADAVVGDVGVVDAGDELDGGRLEGVVGGQGEDEAEGAAGEGGGGGRADGDVPGVEGLGGG